MTDPRPPFRVLILCTGNSARSQTAEALLARKGDGRFDVESAGSQPASRVNPFAVRVLAEAGIAGEGKTPKGLEGLERERWDFVITVCDRAREACPIFPGTPVLAHWGMPDPAEVAGSDGRCGSSPSCGLGSRNCRRGSASNSSARSQPMNWSSPG